MAKRKSGKSAAQSRNAFIRSVFDAVANEGRQIREEERKNRYRSYDHSVSARSHENGCESTRSPHSVTNDSQDNASQNFTAAKSGYANIPTYTSPSFVGPVLDQGNPQTGYNYQQGYSGTYPYQHQNQNYWNASPYNYQEQTYGTSAHNYESSMAYQQWSNAQNSNPQYGYQYPAGYSAYAQQQQYQPTPPQIRNPFAPPPPARPQYASQNPQQDPEEEAQIAQWQAQYAPPDPYEKSRKGPKGEKGENPNFTNIGVRQPPVQGSGENGDSSVKGGSDEKKRTVVRKGGGETWEDDTLLEWDPTQFRIMVGNLAGEVTDDSLFKAFAQYGPSKARVVRDKRTTKSKGFGFVAFTDGDLGFKAAREMTGKYIGSHPVTIERSKTDVRPVSKKDKHKHNNKNKDKGSKGGDQLRANTGAHIEKKPVKNPAGYKVLG